MKRSFFIKFFFFLLAWSFLNVASANLVARHFSLKEGEKFYSKLLDADLSPQEASLVISKLSRYISLDLLPVGYSFSVFYNERGVPVKLQLVKDVGEELEVDLRTLKVKKIKLKTKTFEEEYFGILHPGESVFLSIYKKTGSVWLAYEFTEIFKYRIDFHTWSRPGDYYAFICRVVEDEKGRKKFGKILVAEYVGKKVKAEAAYYKGAYYDRKGRPLVGYFLASPFSFLRAPLRYRRISSRFSYHRLHPILGIVRPHLGVDYAAPEGTPVRSVADGKVIWKGWLGGFGRTIKIRHRGGIITQYAHLSRYARGIHVGSRVKKGQIIGYVGHTGLATGPHLDFRIKVKGRYVDPLKFLARYSRRYYAKRKNIKPLPPQARKRLATLFERLKKVVAKYKTQATSG